MNKQGIVKERFYSMAHQLTQVTWILVFLNHVYFPNYIIYPNIISTYLFMMIWETSKENSEPTFRICNMIPNWPCAKFCTWTKVCITVLFFIQRASTGGSMWSIRRTVCAVPVPGLASRSTGGATCRPLTPVTQHTVHCVQTQQQLYSLTNVVFRN